MGYTDAIEPVTALKNRSSELIRKARETGQPVILTRNGKATAVLQDVESYERQQQSLALLKIAVQGVRDYQAGAVLSDDEADAHFKAKLEELSTDV